MVVPERGGIEMVREGGQVVKNCSDEGVHVKVIGEQDGDGVEEERLDTTTDGRVCMRRATRGPSKRKRLNKRSSKRQASGYF